MRDGQRVALNTCLMLLKQVLLGCLSVIFVGYIARTVGVSAWGEFQTSVALTTMVALVAGMGIRAYLAREIAISPQLGPRHLGSALLIRGLLGAVMLSLTVLFLWLSSTGPRASLVLLTAASQLASLLYTTTWLGFEAHERFQYILYVELCARLFVIALASALLALGYGIFAVAWAFLIGNAAELLLTYYFLCKHLYRPRFDARWIELLGIVRQSLAIGLLGALTGALQQVDRILLRMLGGDAAVGVFSAAWVLSDQCTMLADLFLGAAFAAGVRRFVKDERAFNPLYQSFMVVAAAVGLPVAAGTCLLGPDIIALVYRKPEYLAAGSVLRILTWQLPLTFAFRVGTLPLIAAKRELAVTKILLGALGVDVLGNLLFVPHLGALGTALSAVGASVASLLGAALLSARWMRQVPGMRIGLIALATGIMSLAAFATRSAWGLWAAVFIGALVYVVLLFALRAVTPAEIVSLLRRPAPRRAPAG